MKKTTYRKIGVCMALVACGASASAVSFEFKAAMSSGLATANGVDLATGNLVRFGVFNIADAQVSANANNISYLESHFTEIAWTLIGNNNPTGSAGGDSDPANAGLFSDALARVNTTASGLNIAGRYLVYWVYDASAVALAGQHGIFSSTDWSIPAGNGDDFDFSVLYTDISDLTVNNFGHSLAPSARILVGGFGPGVNPQGGGTNFTLSPIIPEPATVAGAIALLGAAVVMPRLVRRYRKRSVA